MLYTSRQGKVANRVHELRMQLALNLTPAVRVASCGPEYAPPGSPLSFPVGLRAAAVCLPWLPTNAPCHAMPGLSPSCIA